MHLVATALPLTSDSAISTLFSTPAIFSRFFQFFLSKSLSFLFMGFYFGDSDWIFCYLQEKDCDICGVEIADGALPVNEHPFKKSTAFLLGNEVIHFGYY